MKPEKASTKINCSSDGGYYAIKGFAFQIDKAILEVLSLEDENKEIAIEKIQDISSDNFVMQVKYRETQIFAPSKIKEPVLQLIKEFEKGMSGNNPHRIYYLYCYFKSNCPNASDINLAYVNKILGNKKSEFSDDIKTEFLKKFKLIFSESFQQQFGQVSLKIQETFKSTHIDMIFFWYANIVHFIHKIIITKSISNRMFTKKQIVEYIKSGQKNIFDHSYKEYKGQEAYYKFVESKFIKIKKNQKNLVIFGDTVIDRRMPLGRLIVDLTRQHYKGAQRDIEPITFVVPDEVSKETKKYLIEEKIFFNDGHESINFSNFFFSSPPIINKKVAGNGKATESLEKSSFELRILSGSNFEKTEPAYADYHMIYYFDAKAVAALNDVCSIEICALSTEKIHKLYKL